MSAIAAILLALPVSTCSPGPESADSDAADVRGAVQGNAAAAPEAPEAAAPGAPPGERGPAPRAASGDPGAEGAAEVVRSYFALIAARRFDEAVLLLDEGVRPRGRTEANFAAAFDRYAEYHAEVGTPGRIEGAAGSLWVEVPVRVLGRMKDGDMFAGRGLVVLRRCNDVPGCTEEQRRWRIEAENIGLE